MSIASIAFCEYIGMIFHSWAVAISSIQISNLVAWIVTIVTYLFSPVFVVYVPVPVHKHGCNTGLLESVGESDVFPTVAFALVFMTWREGILQANQNRDDLASKRPINCFVENLELGYNVGRLKYRYPVCLPSVTGVTVEVHHDAD